MGVALLSVQVVWILADASLIALVLSRILKTYTLFNHQICIAKFSAVNLPRRSFRGLNRACTEGASWFTLKISARVTHSAGAYQERARDLAFRPRSNQLSSKRVLPPAGRLKLTIVRRRTDKEA